MGSVSLTQVVQSIKSIPALPVAAQRVSQLADDLRADSRQLAKVISSDQALTSQVLKVANSAFYGLSKQVATVSQAITVLGFGAIKNVALGVAVFGFKGAGDGSALNREEFWRHSLAVATGARLIARRLRYQCPEEAFTLGLLHDIGKLALLDACAPEYAQVLERAAAGCGPLYASELQLLGFDHARAGAELCAHWKLPPSICDVVGAHHAPPGAPAPDNQVLRAVKMANVLANLGQLGYSGERCVPTDFAGWFTAREIWPEQLRELFVHLHVELEAAEKFFELAPVARPCAHIPDTGAPTVWLDLSDPGSRELIALALVHLGYKLAPPGSPPKAGARIVGMVTDTVAVAAKSSMPIVNFAAWRAGQPDAAKYVVAHELLRWLETQLAQPASAAGASAI